MNGLKRSCCVLTIVLVLFGCSKKEDVSVPTEENASSASTDDQMRPRPESESGQQAAQTVTFNKVLETWAQGRKDQAVQLFVNIDWSRPDAFTGGPVFGISEGEFVKLPENQRLQINQEALNASRSIKEIAKYMVEQAKQTPDQTATYRQTLLACGQRLSGDNQLRLIQLVGKAIIGYVEKELGTNN